MSDAPERCTEGLGQAFLTDGGEVGALMRRLDWSASPLGHPECWPQSLRSVVGLMLGSKFPMFVAWGEQLGFLYNDAYADILGKKHPDALGASFRDIWSEIWSDISPLIDAAMAGEAIYRENLPLTMNRRGFDERTWFTFSYSPVRDESGSVAGMFCAVTETTAEVRAARRREAFLMLDDRLRELSDTAQLSYAASELLGEALGAVRVGYGVIDPEAGTIEVERNWSAPGFSAVSGRHNFRDYGSYIDDLRRGETVENGDVETDVRTAGTVEAFRGLGIRAFLDLPVVEGGRTVALLFVHSATPRAWTADEVAFAREFAERTRAAIARRVAEQALTEKEERLRLATENAEVGFWDVDVVNDALIWPARVKAMFGISQHVPVSMSDFYAGLHPDDREPIAAAFAAACHPQRRALYDVEYRTVGKEDGIVRWVAARGRGVFDDGGRCVRVIGTAIDITQRKLATARFEGVFNSQLMGFTIFDVGSGKTLAINDHFLAMTGHSRADFEQGRWDWRDLTPAEHLPKDEAAILQARTRGWWTPYEKEYRRRDGSLFPVRIASAPLPGEPGRVVVSIEDISAQRAADEALRTSEELNRRILASSTDCIKVLDLDGRIEFMSDGGVGILELDDVDAALGKAWPNLWPDDERHKTLSAIDEAKRGGAARFQGFAPTAKGRQRFWDVVVTPISGMDGAPEKLLAVSRDITAVHEAEAQLRELNDTLEQRVAERTEELSESQRRFRGIFDSALQFMALLAPDGTVVEVNQTALAWSQITAAEMVGKPFWLAAPMRENPALQEAIKEGVRRAAAGETVRAEHELRGAGEIRAVVDFSLKPVPGDRGEALWLVAEGRDITELKAAQEALRQSQKMESMGQLTGGVAHDFNNLLTPIVGSLDMLQRKGLGGERERRLVDGALASAERAKLLVQRLLAFARRQPLQASAVDVTKLVEGMADLLASTAGPQVRVAVDLAPDVPLARADANQLEMALLNLGVNARDAMPDGGTLRISASREDVRGTHRHGLGPGAYVRLSVSDTGLGMDEATAKRAVEPFFSTKGIGRGTGLGLSMVHGLALQLGGALAIHSQLGLGTNVEIWLPASSVSADDSSEEQKDSSRAGATGTVLLVDDEDLVRASTADMLADLGFSVVEANSAEAALRLVDCGLVPDLLVTDHLMPGMNGTDLARSLRGRSPDLGVLLVSGYAEADGVAPDLVRLVKPFRQADLAAKLRNLSETSDSK